LNARAASEALGSANSGDRALKIATWNVNSIKARLPHLKRYLQTAAPDILLLQEIKTVEDGFPQLEIQALGYQSVAVGQKSYNGVAILSRQSITPTLRRLPGEAEDEQARYLEARIGPLRVASIYVPNGNPVESDKFAYKLRWLERLRSHVRGLLSAEEILVLGGDYNVVPRDLDVYDPQAWAEDALCRPEVRAKFRALVYLGLTDAFQTLHPEGHRYSFWDYQAGAWPRDNGLRIDHLLLSPKAADRLRAADIDRKLRGEEQASDHVPVWCELEL
jgi:exodeoxyribonuclease III